MQFVIKKKLPNRVYVDTETTGLLPFNGDVPFSVGNLLGSTKDPDYRYFEWKVNPLTRECLPDKADVEQMRDWCEDDRITKICFNLKFDWRMMRKIGVDFKGRLEDVYFAAKICNSLELSYKLKTLAQWHCHYPKDDEDKLKRIVSSLRKHAKKLGWKIAEDVEADYWLCGHVDTLLKQASKDEIEEIQSLVGIYCCGDVYRTALLWERKYCKALDSDPAFRNIYEQEMADLPIVMEMEDRGAHVSKKRVMDGLNHAKGIKEHQLEEILRLITLQRKKAGLPALAKEFNPRSSDQLAAVLYKPLHKGGFDLECKDWTEKGKESVAYGALHNYLEHPFVRACLRHGAYTKGLEFFEKYRDLMIPDNIVPGDDDRIIHGSLNQVQAVTGRFSMGSPNLQNVPKDSSMKVEHSEARSPFGPRPGYFWFPMDYAQMELRVFADLAEVPYLLQAIKEGRDLNDENANKIWGERETPAALEAAARALCLGKETPDSAKVKAVWLDLGWDPANAFWGPYSVVAKEFAEEWLAEFNYEIVAAEKSLGIKSTRDLTKITTFCKLYGGGVDAAMDQMHCSREVASNIWKTFDRQCPEIIEYQNSVSRQARQDGFILTRYGRKILVDSRDSYKAIDYTIQGPCADLMKSAIRRCHKFLKSTGLDAHLVLTIHDELIVEIRKEHSFPWVIKEMMDIMSDHEGRLRVPMPVEASIVRERWDKKESLHFAA